MKIISAFFFFAVVVISCNQETPIVQSDVESANLKGKVWRVEKTIFEAKSKCSCPAAQRAENNKTKYVYNRNGNLIESYTLTDEGDTSLSKTYTFNRHGLCTGVNKFQGTSFVGKEIPVFQGAKLTGYKIFDKDGISEMTMDYVYSGEQIAEEKTLDSRGRVLSSTQNEFVNGQLFSQTERDSLGQVKFIQRYKRNSFGDLTEVLISMQNDTASYRLSFEYEYDKAGNWTKQTRFYDNQIESIVVRNIEYYEN